jgi:hypothetical protein
MDTAWTGFKFYRWEFEQLFRQSHLCERSIFEFQGGNYNYFYLNMQSCTKDL